MTLAAILLMPEREPRAPTSTTRGRHLVSAISILHSTLSTGLRPEGVEGGREGEGEREREREREKEREISYTDFGTK